MENEIFERDYRITEKSKNTSSKKPNIIDYAAESGFFKAYNDAMLKIPKYIVKEDKEAYENLLFRLDMYANRLGGKIKGIVDYEKYNSHIIVELPHFEASDPEEYALLADIAAKTNIVIFEPSEDGGIRLYIMINYFNEIEDADHVLTDCIMNDEKLVEMLTEAREEEKEQILSNPELSEYIKEQSEGMGMTPEEFYDWFEEIYSSDPERINKILFDQLSGKNEEEDSE